MKYPFLSAVAATLLSVTLAFGQHSSQGIIFEQGTFADVLQKAKQTNKSIFMDAYTTWCGPCKAMTISVFPNDEVAEFYNKNFICYKVDMEKGEGLDLAKKYTVNAYPNLLYMNPEGEILHRVAGFQNAPNFIKLGETALNPAERFKTIQGQYWAGGASPALAVKYLLMLADAALPYDKPSMEYFSTQPESEYTSRNSWKIIYNLANNLNHKMFNYLVQNKDKYAAVYGKDSVENKINAVYIEALGNAAESEPQSFDSLSKTYYALNLKRSKDDEMSLGQAEMIMLKHKKDWPAYNAKLTDFVNKHLLKNATGLNSVSWDVYENSTDKNLLAKAEGWSALACKLEPKNFNAADTHAALLFKNGKSALAKAAAQKAIALGKKNNEDVSSTEQLLEQINQKLKKK